MKKLVVLVVLFLTQQVVRSVPLNGVEFQPRVTVQDGVILGLQETQNEVEMFVYRGIPYAKPPTGKLRFMPPKPIEPWTDVLDATDLPTKCPQFTGGKEDCLYLNVYTPTNVNDTGPLSVMVFIHGGAWVIGSSHHYDSTYPLVQNDVIVVVIQYRIGILGFLSTDDEVVPGNMGLKDQTLALKWIKNNIASFGGDSDSITIFGQSAGAASSHFQVLTPYSEGLFNRYILMSGNSFMPWSTGRDFYEISRDLARRNGCPENPSYDLIVCLQEIKNVFLFNRQLHSYFIWNYQPFMFGPRVDGDFIPDEPARLIMSGQYKKLPSLMGVVANEWALETAEMYSMPRIIDELYSNFTYNGAASLSLFADEEPVKTTNSSYNYYLDDALVNNDNADNVTKMYTDRLFHVGLDLLVEQQADTVDTFMYQFDHRGLWGFEDIFKPLGLNISSADTWIAHSDDLQYIFERVTPLQDEDDIMVSCLYSTYFTNFAKFGDPTPDSEFCLEASDFSKWEKTNSRKLRHLSITTKPFMTDDTRQDVREFWNNQPLRINSILQG